MDRILERLRIENTDEAAAIRTLVVTVIHASRKSPEAHHEARTKYGNSLENEDLSGEELGKQIEKVQAGLRKFEKEPASVDRPWRKS